MRLPRDHSFYFSSFVFLCFFSFSYLQDAQTKTIPTQNNMTELSPRNTHTHTHTHTHTYNTYMTKSTNANNASNATQETGLGTKGLAGMGDTWDGTGIWEWNGSWKGKEG